MLKIKWEAKELNSVYVFFLASTSNFFLKSFWKESWIVTREPNTFQTELVLKCNSKKSQGGCFLHAGYSWSWSWYSRRVRVVWLTDPLLLLMSEAVQNHNHKRRDPPPPSHDFLQVHTSQKSGPLGALPFPLPCQGWHYFYPIHAHASDHTIPLYIYIMYTYYEYYDKVWIWESGHIQEILLSRKLLRPPPSTYYLGNINLV
jgi:hypothetical protein